jgi:hypothetical protein
MGALESDSEADPVVGCCVRDGRPGTARVWPDTGPVTPATGIRRDARHDQRTCLLWCRRPMGDDLGSGGPGCLPRHHGGGFATGPTFRSCGLGQWGRRCGHGGGVRPARPWKFSGPHRRRDDRLDSPGYLAAFRCASRSMGATVGAPRLGRGVSCPDGARGVVRG